MATLETDLLHDFEGMYSDGDDVRCYSRKVVRTRVEHQCPGMFAGALHSFPAGFVAVRERALVDGRWKSCYTCEGCIKAWRARNNED